MEITSLDEIRNQAEPEVIEIPGFKPGKTINVAVKPLDLTPYLLKLNIGNPLVVQNGAKPAEEIAIKDILPLLDEMVREALVNPTYDDIAAISPLTLQQKLAIFNYVMKDVVDLQSFRSE
jgi:hypothetical protein